MSDTSPVVSCAAGGEPQPSRVTRDEVGRSELGDVRLTVMMWSLLVGERSRNNVGENLVTGTGIIGSAGGVLGNRCRQGQQFTRRRPASYTGTFGNRRERLLVATSRERLEIVWSRVERFFSAVDDLVSVLVLAASTTATTSAHNPGPHHNTAPYSHATLCNIGHETRRLLTRAAQLLTFCHVTCYTCNIYTSAPVKQGIR